MINPLRQFISFFDNFVTRFSVLFDNLGQNLSVYDLIHLFPACMKLPPELFFFKDKEEFLRMIKYLYMGMTLFIIISFLYPNGLDIRPAYFERDNIFIRLVQMIYQNDTSTNVVPSIHAYNSIVVMVAALRSEKVLPKKWQKAVCCIISGLIILSTVFTKQHSVLDVFAAIILAWIGYQLYYKRERSVVKETDTVKA